MSIGDVALVVIAVTLVLDVGRWAWRELRELRRQP